MSPLSMAAHRVTLTTVRVEWLGGVWALVPRRTGQEGDPVWLTVNAGRVRPRIEGVTVSSVCPLSAPLRHLPWPHWPLATCIGACTLVVMVRWGGSMSQHSMAAHRATLTAVRVKGRGGVWVVLLRGTDQEGGPRSAHRRCRAWSAPHRDRHRKRPVAPLGAPRRHPPWSQWSLATRIDDCTLLEMVRWRGSMNQHALSARRV